jgi:hypothetical protein
VEHYRKLGTKIFVRKYINSVRFSLTELTVLPKVPEVPFPELRSERSDEELELEYEKLAIRFANRKSAECISMSMKSVHGDILVVKFSARTGETLVVVKKDARATPRIVTYYRIDDIEISRSMLKKRFYDSLVVNPRLSVSERLPLSALEVQLPFEANISRVLLMEREIQLGVTPSWGADGNGD